MSKTIYDYKVESLDGQEINFADFKGKKILVVNTASECGFTPQYADLEKLSKEYEKNLVIVGFPANNFGGQEPGSNTEIGAFCEKNFGVTFPLFKKDDVKGENKQPVYQWLSDKNKNGWNEIEPKWNFFKYLIDETGILLKVASSSVSPADFLE